MRSESRIAVIIPALNEEQSLSKVLSAIPIWVDEVVVVDNGSTDGTAMVARAHCAHIVEEFHRGYGSACLAGITALNNPDVAVFLDADFSDDPGEMERLVDPIVGDQVDFVIGSRTRGSQEPGALTYQARFGNKLACALIRRIWGFRYTDLGPFRAIRFSKLKALDMRDRNYGWTVEMQIKAVRKRLRIQEVPVNYRRRIGTSKISGRLRGVLGAGFKILTTIFLQALHSRPRSEAAHERIIVFTRYPQPGQAKTRLIPTLGPVGAAKVHARMARATLARIRTYAEHHRLSIEVHFEDGNPDLMRSWLGGDLSYFSQETGDLGTRLLLAFRKAFDAGMKKVVIIGTDCPGLTVELIQKSFNALKNADVVLGPAVDGGYYLIGLRRPISELFKGISWGTGSVLEQSLSILRRLKIQVETLPWLRDVDRPDDLFLLGSEWETHEPAAARPRISIIIAALNEGKYIGAAVRRAKAVSECEVIVVDGGSHDDTVEVAKASGVEVLICPPGRGAQMNRGAAVAKGEFLLFLHADTLLPEGFDEPILDTLKRPGVVAGAFGLGIDGPGRRLRVIEWLANWRSRRLHMPYGDQGIFLKASLFREIGGFPDVPIMEDFDFIRRLQKRGRIRTAPVRVLTSARRWERIGLLRTTLMNQVMIVGHFMGVAPERLARWYNRNQGGG